MQQLFDTRAGEIRGDSRGKLLGRQCARMIEPDLNEQRLSRMETKLDRMEERFDQTMRLVDQLAQMVAENNRRVAEVQTSVADLRSEVTGLQAHIFANHPKQTQSALRRHNPAQTTPA